MLRKLLIAVCATGIATSFAKQPNIVFVFSDDHATQALGSYGFPLAKLAPTPHLDQLAENGMRFDRCMVTNSICGPSRATILTGKYGHKNGFIKNNATAFDGSQQTFPKLLQQAGYQTAIIGKWHLGSKPTGFDHWDILPGQGSYYNPDFKNAEGTYRVEGYCSEVITEKAKVWLSEQRNKDKPFILMVQHKAPHRSWLPSPEYLTLFDDVTFPEPDTLFDNYEGRGTAAKTQDLNIEHSMELAKDLKVQEKDVTGWLVEKALGRMTDAQRDHWNEAYQPKNDAFLAANLTGKDLVRWKYQRYVKDYLRCVRSVDDSVGEVKQALEEQGLAENTVFVYSSDQGFYLGEHGWFDKRFMYDESYRTPLLISWPGKVKAGQVNSDLVSNLDFAGTFLEMAGAEIPSDIQGESLVPILTGDESKDWRSAHYYHYYEYPGYHMVQRHEGIYDGRYKLMNFYDIKEWELYDLETDPQEMKSVYADPAYADVRKRLHKELDDLRELYDVPENVLQDLSNLDKSKHSAEMRKNGAERKKKREEAEKRKKLKEAAEAKKTAMLIL